MNLKSQQVMRKLQLGHQALCIPNQAIRRIIPPGLLSPLPGVAQWIKGYIGSDNSYIPLVDLSAFCQSRLNSGRQWVELEPNSHWPHWCLLVDATERVNVDSSQQSSAQHVALAQHALLVEGQAVDCLDPSVLQQLPERNFDH